MYALNIDKETNRILSATFSRYATDGMPIVDTLPDGDITDYLYDNGEYIYEPMIVEVVEKPVSEIEQLRADIEFLALMTGVEL